MEDETATTPRAQGQFVRALTAPNSKIKTSRALQLTETTRTTYRRRVEDLANDIRMKRLDAQGQLDLRGDNAFSLNPSGKDFSAVDWVQANLEARMEIRNLTMKLAVAYYGYCDLFGPDTSLIQDIDISGVEGANITISLLD